jgi:hypothetical protein
MTTPTSLTPGPHAWLDSIQKEVEEAFAPAKRWRRAAPAERTIDLLDLVHGTPLTLVYWRWQVEVRREKSEWVIVALKARPDLDVRGVGRAETYPEALVLLADTLTKSIAARRKAMTRPSIAA